MRFRRMRSIFYAVSAGLRVKQPFACTYKSQENTLYQRHMLVMHM